MRARVCEHRRGSTARWQATLTDLHHGRANDDKDEVHNDGSKRVEEVGEGPVLGRHILPDECRVRQVDDLALVRVDEGAQLVHGSTRVSL